MDLSAIQCVLAATSYKPKWKISAYETEAQGIWIKFCVEMEDSYHPGKGVQLYIKSPIPPCKDAVALLVWLRWRIERVEVHECHEWLKYGGCVIWDPHADGADEPKDTVREAYVELPG